MAQTVGECGRWGLIPGSGRSSGEGKGYPFQYSCHGEFHGPKSLIGYSPWGYKESDMTESLSLSVKKEKKKKPLKILTVVEPFYYGKF